MKNFVKVIKEINKTLNFFIVFESILNAGIFFLAVYLALSLINLFTVLAIIPAAIYFAMRVYTNSKMDKRRIVEGKYGPLNEKLRTAADNINEENPVVNELDEEVVQDLKHVGLSSFIQTNQISYKFFTAISLSFIIFFATTLNLYIVDLDKFF